MTDSWYAVYTRPRWEKKVAALLAKKRIEHYCPLNKVLKQWSDRKKLVEEPLFSSYVFVRIADADKWRIKEIDGILNYVYWLGKPAQIPNHEIETIKRFLNEHESVQLKPLSLKANDQVRIVSGPFMNQQATVQTVKGKHVKVEIPSLNIALTATVRLADIELV
jgi:transcription antitermination factor NusG